MKHEMFVCEYCGRRTHICSVGVEQGWKVHVFGEIYYFCIFEHMHEWLNKRKRRFYSVD